MTYGLKHGGTAFTKADPRFVGVCSLSPYTGPDPYYQGEDAVSCMQVTADFGFIDKYGVTWMAHKGDLTDGANLPEWSEWLIGGSFDSPYLAAAVLHDVWCRNKQRSWRDTDEMFREAMVVNGVSEPKAYAMYMAVYAYHLFKAGW
jgi:uncharacterized protein DUF1353